MLPPQPSPFVHLLSCPFRQSHPGTPGSCHPLLPPPHPFPFSCSVGGLAELQEGRGQCHPEQSSRPTSLPQPSRQCPPKSCPWSRIPRATELRQAGSGRLERSPSPRQGQLHVRGPDPAEGPPAVREWWTRCLVSATHRSPARRSPAVSHGAKLWLRALGIVYTGRRALGHVSSTFPPKSEEVGDGTLGDSHLSNSGSSQSSRDCSLLLCQRLQTALPAGIREDSTATSPRPGG